MNVIIPKLAKLSLRCLIVYALSCFALLSHPESVLGTALPNFNTSDGERALFNITTGVGNSGFGSFALFSNSTASYNTAVGTGALDLNNGESNTAVGAAALLFNTIGHGNTATGVDALYSNTTGTRNTATGAFALFMNTIGNENTAVGNQALGQTAKGTGNIAVGHQAGFALGAGSNNIDIGNVGVTDESNTIRIGDPAIHAALFIAGITEMSPAAPNQAVLVEPNTGQLGSVDISSFGVVTTSPENTAVGDQALVSNTGYSNTATGFRALFSNTNGYRNTACGANALASNTGDNTGNGTFNCAFGAFALNKNDNGFSNNAVGDDALFGNISAYLNTAFGDLALTNNDSNGAGKANFNTAVGAQALFQNTDGQSNNAVGYNALGNNTTGNFNIAIGDSAGDNVTTASNVICIGDLVAGENLSGSCYIGNIAGASGGAQAVYVNANGKLGFQVSSRRFKDEIKPIQQASEVIYRLKPVSFRYKREIEPTRLLGFGLIAEEVEKINPDLVTRDSEGNVGSVRYDAVNAMLLNEFLKEHQTVQELKKQVAELTVSLQKVSAQLELNNPAPQVADNP